MNRLASFALAVPVLLTAMSTAACGGQPPPGNAEPDAAEPDAAEPDVVGGEPDPEPSMMEPDSVPTEPVIVGGDRPVEVYVPETYRSDEPAPLLLFLHGYGFSGASYEATLHLRDFAEARGFLYAVPEGNIDSSGAPFWNAFSVCCDFEVTQVDDAGYLRSVIEETAERLAVLDERRVFLVGHSNGGFMSYKVACEHSDLIAAVVSLSGAMTSSANECPTGEPVSVLQVHGTADTTVQYGGGSFGGPSYLGAVATADEWAERVGCQSSTEQDLALDLDAATAGAETSVKAYDDCSSGRAVELWTVSGGAHVMDGTPAFFPSVLDFLEAHPKP